MSDTIDRQAAIEIVDRYDKSHMILKGKPMLGAASIVIELEALPSAQPEQRWIPVKEKLPDPLQEVLVTSTRGYVYTSRIVHGDFEYGGNVIAWMPLSEPWKEGEA